jgi:hypothetical protein
VAESRTETAQSRDPRATAKEQLSAFLESRPAGADAAELVGLLLSGTGSDPDLAPRLISGLLAGDPNFRFDSATGTWSLARSRSNPNPRRRQDHA